MTSFARARCPVAVRRGCATRSLAQAVPHAPLAHRQPARLRLEADVPSPAHDPASVAVPPAQLAVRQGSRGRLGSYRSASFRRSSPRTRSRSRCMRGDHPTAILDCRARALGPPRRRTIDTARRTACHSRLASMQLLLSHSVLELHLAPLGRRKKRSQLVQSEVPPPATSTLPSASNVGPGPVVNTASNRGRIRRVARRVVHSSAPSRLYTAASSFPVERRVSVNPQSTLWPAHRRHRGPRVRLPRRTLLAEEKR